MYHLPEYPSAYVRRPLGGVGTFCITLLGTLTRLPADNVSEDEFYSILQATGIGEKGYLNP